MAITVASLVAKVQTDTTSATRSLGGFMGTFAAAGIAAAAMALGVGIAAAKMAGNFQTGMNTLVTGAGESAANLKLVSDGVLQLATDTGTSTKQLTDGMFMIESAGFHGAAGLDVLKNAAEGAKVGNADLKSVANAVTTEMVDYKDKNLSAAAATNILIATVANGKTTMEELSGAMSTILPTASAARIGLIDVQGAMATMTGEGVDAANAATYLRQLIVALQAPSKGTAKALADIGLSTTQVANEMKVSLPDAIALIEDHLKKKFPEGSAAYVAALKSIAGGSKQMQGLLDLTGTHLQTFKDNVDSITGAVKQGGDGITGWARVQQSFNFQLDKAKEVAETLGIKLGTFLIPIFTSLMQTVGNQVMPVIRSFENLLSPVQNTASQVGDKIGGLAAACQKLAAPFDDGSRAVGRLTDTVKPLIPKFDEGSIAAQKVTDAAKNLVKPFDEGSVAVAKLTGTVKDAKPPVTAVQAVLNGLTGFVKANVVPAVDKLWTTFKTQMLPELVKFAGFVKSDVLPVVEKLALWFLTKVLPAAQQVAIWFMTKVLPILEELWKVIAADVIPTLQGIANNVMENLVPALENLWNKISPVLIPAFHAIGDVLKNTVGPALNTVIGIVSGLINVIATVIGKIGDFFNLLGTIKDKVGGAASAVGNFFGGIGSHLPHFADGGTMPFTGMAMVGERGPELVRLPGGSQVMNSLQTGALQRSAPGLSAPGLAGSVAPSGASSGAGRPFIIKLDSRTLARGIMPAVGNEIRTAAVVRHM